MSREAHTINVPALAALYEGMTAAGILNAFAGRIISGPDADGFADVIGYPDRGPDGRPPFRSRVQAALDIADQRPGGLVHESSGTQRVISGWTARDGELCAEFSTAPEGESCAVVRASELLHEEGDCVEIWLPLRAAETMSEEPR